MRKVLLLLVTVICCTFVATAVTPHYKGYAELYSGYSMPSNYYENGISYGLSTSHGITLIDGLFLGLGVDASINHYTESYRSGKHWYEDEDNAFLFAGFAEARYAFLRTKRISPFVGLRGGAGYNGYDEEACSYFGALAGCTFNFTKKFGLDVSIGYGRYSGETGDYNYDDYSEGINQLSFRVGVHF